MTSLADKSDLFMTRTGMDGSQKPSNPRKTADFIWLRGFPGMKRVLNGKSVQRKDTSASPES